jgi:WD40 repeat protein
MDNVLAAMTSTSRLNPPSPHVFDVFLSHNSKEKSAVERIAEKLKREAVEPWLDKWCLTPGGDWQDELAEGLRRSTSCAVFIGPEGIGDWARLEFKLATDRMAKDRNFRVFLVLLPDLPEPFDTSSLPPFLSTRTWVDMRRGVGDPRALQTFINAVKGIAPGPETPIAPRDDICPYRGLRAFDEEHSEFFFGRDGDVQRLVEKLKSTRFLAVLGASGSGKSSVVRAGLLPALRKGALTESETWSVRVFTPGARPLASLAANVVRFFPQSSVVKTLDELSADERTLHLTSEVALAGRPASERVLWVIDQFEEVFTLCHDALEREKFIDNVLYAAAAPGGRNAVVLTMRADFYQKCAAYPELSAHLAAHQFLVTPMSLDGLRQAIAEPAWRVGLELEPGLVETILEDVESQPGALPLLEHALLELWERRRGRLLTLEAYRETGGVEGAIAKRADAIFESFDSERQTIARRVMLRLTQPGEGTEDTRRRATLGELVTTPGEAEKVREVVGSLADARLLMTDTANEGGSEVVDVSHEALIRGWPRLRRWVEEDRQGLRVHRRLTEAAQEWHRASHDESLLFRGARLAQTAEWRERNQSALNELERQFLDASTALQSRERTAAQRRTRRIVIGLVAALVLISGASVFAFIQSRLAQKRGEEAFARELAATALSQLSVNPELSLLLATEAAKRATLTETENTLRQVLARSPVHVLRTGTPGISVLDVGRPTAVFSSGGKLLHTSFGRTFATWDVESGQKQYEKHLDGPVVATAVTADAKLVAYAVEAPTTEKGPDPNFKRTIQVVEAATGNERFKCPDDQGVSELAFSPDGKFIMLGSQSVKVCELSSGQIVAEVEGLGPTLDRNGRLILTKGGEQEDKLFVTRVGSWERVAEIPSTPERWSGAPFGSLSPDGRFVLAGTETGQVQLYDVASQKKISEFTSESEQGAREAAFSPDGRFVAFATFGQPYVWDTKSGETPTTPTMDSVPRPIFGTAFSPEGRSLLTISLSARLHDVGSGRRLAEFRAIGGYSVVAAKFSPDGRNLLTLNDSGTVCVWDAGISRASTVLDAERKEIYPNLMASASFTPDGRLVAYVIPGEGEGQPDVLQVLEPGSGRVIQSSKHSRSLETVQIISDGSLILTTDEKSMQIWDVGNGRLRSEFPHAESQTEAALSPDGKLIVIATSNGARVLDANSGKILKEIPTGGEVNSATFNPNGERVLLTSIGQARVWELSSGRFVLEVGERRQTDGLSMAVYSADGKYIMTWDRFAQGSTGTSVQVRDAETGRIVIELSGHTDNVLSSSVSSDGRFVLTTSGYQPSAGGGESPPEEANSVRIWDLASGTTLYDFRDHGQRVVAGAFTANGKSVLALDASRATFVYACDLCVPQDELLKLAEKRNVRQLTPDERVRYLHEDRPQ